MIKFIRFGDIIIFISIIAFSFFYSKRLIENNKSSKVIIDSYNKSLRFDLNIDKDIIIEGLLGESKILIKDNHIQFLESPCRDKLCIKAGILKNSPLICMPNGIIIRFENNFDKDTEIDSIVWWVIIMSFFEEIKLHKGKRRIYDIIFFAFISSFIAALENMFPRPIPYFRIGF